MVPPPPNLDELCALLEHDLVQFRAFLNTLRGPTHARSQLEAAGWWHEHQFLLERQREVRQLEAQRRLWGTPLRDRDRRAVQRLDAVLERTGALLTEAITRADVRLQAAMTATGFQGQPEAWRDAATGNIRQPVAHLPLVRELIEASLEGARELRADLEIGVNKPQVFDDAMIERIVKQYAQDGPELIEVNRWQLRRWLGEALPDETRLEVERLLNAVDETEREGGRIVTLAQQIAPGTMDRIMEQSDVDLGLKVLLGEVKLP
jgi:hypothetical protein